MERVVAGIESAERASRLAEAVGPASRRSGLASRGVFVLALLAGISTAQTVSPVGIALQKVASRFSAPLGILFPADGSKRMFVVEQAGRIRIVESGGVLSPPFLDIKAKIRHDASRGLMGLVFHPAYTTTGRFFVYYTDKQGGLSIVEYRVSSDPRRADASSAKLILRIPHPKTPGHYGGQMAFGPDGLLYIATGDGGGVGDPANTAQDLTTLLGKMLRIDVDHGDPYAIPEGNPFAGGDPKDDPIWAYGLRNPWRFSFDRKTGDLFIADVGERCVEEVNFQRAGSAGGQNYGWKIMEGDRCFNPDTSTCVEIPGCDRSGLTMPIITCRRPGELECRSITGGYSYRGRAIPELKGQYIYGDFCTGEIWSARRERGKWTSTLLLDTRFLITTFGEDQSGEIYLTAAATGDVYRIVPGDSRTSQAR